MVEGTEVAVGDIVAERYRVDRILGQGAMGVVVAATHIELHQTRAIKFMLPEALADKEGVERFLREARAAAKLTSPHAVKVHDVARLPTGEPYMVMEYLEGTDLKRYLAEKRVLPVPEAISYILQACDALAEAHAAGIVHRDLKPANMFLAERAGSPPVLKVLDFGIAKVNDQGGGGSDGQLTATQTVIGSPLYMSPEQIISTRNVDARSDVWSLGVILYVLVTGMVPFRGDSTQAIFASVQRDDPVPPSMWMPSLPRKLEQIILTCLEKEPARRCPSARELAAALKAFQAEPAVAPAPPAEVAGGGTQLMKPASAREPASRPSAPSAPPGYSQPAAQGYPQAKPYLATQPMPGSYPAAPGYSQPGSGHYPQAGGYAAHPQAGYPQAAPGSYPAGGPGSYPQAGAPGYGAASASYPHAPAPGAASYPQAAPAGFPQAGAQTNSPLTQPVEAAPRRRNRELLLVGGGFATALVIVGAFVLFSGGGNSKESTTTPQGVTAAPAPSPAPPSADTAAITPSAAPSAVAPADPGASPTAPSAPPDPAANTPKAPVTSGGTAAAPKPKSPTSPAPTTPATQKPAPAPTPTTTTGAPLKKRHD